jgi:type II secretory pathway component PulF
MKLEFRAFDKTGREVCSVVEAGSLGEAMDRLHQQDLFVADIAPAGRAVAAKTWRLHLPRSRIRVLRELALFTRQLHSLIRSGTPLAQGLRALERQARNPWWRQIIQDVCARLERGLSLSEALGAHPECFDSVYRAMVAAGEGSGKLTVLLDRLAVLTRKRVHILSTVRAAMTYPILLCSVATAVFGVLLLFVVPRFGELFASIGAPMPPTTAALIAAGEGLRAYWWAWAGAIIAAVVAARQYVKSPAGKRAADTILLRVPQIGSLVKNFITARIVRLLGLLVDSHLPIQDILSFTRGATSNVHYGALLAKAEQAVGHGEPVSSVFRETNLISPSVYEAMRSGEQSGQVGPLLLELADFLDDENELSLKSLTSIVEPALLILMGLMVGFVAISIFLPLFDVTSMMSGGGAS